MTSIIVFKKIIDGNVKIKLSTMKIIMVPIFKIDGGGIHIGIAFINKNTTIVL